ncbi:LUD domain-containing protein [Candidatus Gottesmanbacteria bacterium]|nr:LUD domain-containing protein [Candidatus Gottesmanbacteria bacterium]
MKSAFDQLANNQSVQNTIESLKNSGIDAIVVATGDEAKKKVLEMLPKGAEVMNMSSVTLETIGLDKEINESGNYDAVKPKLFKMDRKTQGVEMQKLGAAPVWTVGSVHAVTEDGKILIASNSGSQLGPYAYASAHVIWIVGIQKIVKNLDEGINRINDYVLPLEDKHMHQLYGVGSNVSKLLIINKEIKPGRITLIFVKEKLGF